MPLDWWGVCVASMEIHESQTPGWLYGTTTSRCGCGHDRDNDPSTTFSHVFLPSLFGLAMIGIACVSRSRLPKRALHQEEKSNGVKEKEDVCDLSCVDPELAIQDDSQSCWTQPKSEGNLESSNEFGFSPSLDASPKKVRLWHVDYARIICVACVVTEHCGGEVYADRNIAWVQQWVLPYLYTIGGVSFMFSSGSIWAYILKLLVVFIVGTSANAVSFALAHQEWPNDFWEACAITTYQMGYVLIIMATSFLLAPLRHALRWRQKNASAPPNATIIAWTVVWGMTTIVMHGFTFSGWPLSNLMSGDQQDLISYGPIVAATYTGPIFLSFLMCSFGSSGWAVWIVMVVIYMHRIVIPYGKGWHPLNADLFLLGMLVQAVPPYGITVIAQTAREYWPIVFATLLLLSTPGVTGRCDLQPMYNVWERSRFYSIEFALVVLLISGAFNTSDSKRITGWLNRWALYAYCFHECWARMFANQTHGALFTYAAVPVFYWFDRFFRSRKDREVAKPVSKEQGHA